MVRKPNHAIGTKAVHIIKQKLVMNWSFDSPEDEDHGIDFAATHFEKGGELSGLEIKIQSKGSRSLKVSREQVVFDFPVKNLTAYIDRVRIPVLIFCVDVSSEKAFYACANDVVTAFNVDWRSKKKVRIRINASNDADDLEQFQKYCWHWFNHVTSPQEWLGAHAREIARHDNRFNVSPFVGDGVFGFKLEPNSDAPGFTFEPKFDAEVRGRALEAGEEVEYRPGEFYVGGRELPGVFCGIDGGKIRIGSEAEAILRYELIKGGEVVGDFDFYRGKLFWGKESRWFEGSTEEQAISVVHDFERVDMRSGSFRLKLSVNYSKYDGKVVQRLPYVSKLRDFLSKISSADALRCTVKVSGVVYVSQATKELIGLEDLEDLRVFIEFWNKVLKFSNLIRVALPYRTTVSVDDQFNVNRTVTLLVNRDHLKGDGFSVGVTSKPSAILRQLRSGELHGKRSGAEFRICFEKPIVTLLGVSVELPSFSVVVTSFKVEPKKSLLLRNADHDLKCGNNTTLRFVGTKRSKVSVELTEELEWEDFRGQECSINDANIPVVLVPRS